MPILKRVALLGIAVGIVLVDGSLTEAQAQHNTARARHTVSLDDPAPIVAHRAARRSAALQPRALAINPVGVANEADSLALVALANATGLAGWVNNANWVSGPLATWHGVTLNDDGRVVALDLRENNLAGMLPDELGDLTQLEALLLAGNRLTGPMPQPITTLTLLAELSLWGNTLTGSLPAALGQLTALKDLLLFGNDFDGPIPPELGQLTNLERLWLDGNRFTGSIPAQLANLAQLRELFLDDNELVGPVPPELATLDNLIILSLGDNPLGGGVPLALTTMTNLEDLWLFRSGLTGQIPPELAGMTSLASLFLNGNQLTGEIPDVLAGLQNLVLLYLGDNNLTGPIPEALAGIQNLRDLDLHGNALTGSIPSSLGFLGILELLDLRFNQLTGDLPTNLGFLRQLQDLHLDGNQFTGELAVLLNMGRLTNVTVRDNAFTGEMPLLVFLPRLQIVDLGGNRLTGEIDPTTGNLPFLETLLLDDNQLTGAVPPAIANLSNLRLFSFDKNQIEELPDLTALAGLQQVNAGFNRLTFEDIEPNVSLAGGGSNFNYAPQDTIPTGLTRLGSTVVFSVSVGGANNQYQWFRDGMAVDGATADTLAVDATGAVATYHCEITNTVATALTLTSEPLRTDAVPTSLEEKPEAAALPEAFALHANYPNPFNPVTHISFDVATPNPVRLTVYDALGRVVARLLDKPMPAGRHEVVFEANRLPSGVYLYRIEMGAFSATRTMLLMK